MSRLDTQRSPSVWPLIGRAVFLLCCALGLQAVEPQVAGGNSHTVLLDADGSVWAAGANGSGQLGDATTNPRGLAARVQYAIGGDVTNCIEVSAGSIHSLALRADGTVWAWGSNGSGQLGNKDGTGNVLGARQVVVLDGSGLDQVIAISAGAAFSLALRADGTVWAWGNDGLGQLGNDGVNSGNINYAVQVAGLTNIVQVEAGYAHSLARVADGTVRAWGYNFFGQLGNNTKTTAYVPVTVSGISDAADIAAGQYHSLCLLAEQGHVKSWGYNNYGQLGRNTVLPDTADYLTPGYLVEMSGSATTGIKKIATGGDYGDHSLLLRYDGVVLGCGKGDGGQLGGTSHRSMATVISGITRVRSFAAGDYHTMFMKADGTVWHLGNNVSGQCLTGTVGGTSTTPAQSQASWSMVGMMAVSAGNSHTMYLKADGTVWVSGSNDYYQLTGTGTSLAVPQQITDPNIINIIAIAAGSYHSMALRADGRVYCWGRNDKGAVGNGQTLPAANVSVPYQPMAGIKAIAAGGGTSYALQYQGYLSSWGENGSYQLARRDGVASDRSSPDWVWSNYTTFLYPVLAIEAGGSHAMALWNNGRAVIWGENEAGQYGNGNKDTEKYASQVADTTMVKGLAGGRRHTLLLTASGTVEGMGDYGRGQLGHGVAGGGDPDPQPTPVTASLPATELAKQVSAGGEFGDCSAALVAGGRVYTWGTGASGQLGNNSLLDSSLPVKVVSGTKFITTYISNAVALSAGDFHMGAVIASGSIRTWGENSNGELANNNVPTDARIGAFPIANWLPTVSVSALAPTASEGVVPISGTYRLTRTLSTPGTLNIPVYMGGDASISDYQAIPASVVIGPGVSSVDVTLTPTDDFVAEGAEPATLSITGAGLFLAAAAPDNAASITISDNDVAGITRSAVAGALTEAGGQATFTLVLDSQPTADVQITLAVSDTTPSTVEATISPVAVTFTPATWNVAQVVTVTGLDDAIDDGDQLVTVTINNSTSLDSNYNRPPNPQTNPVLGNQDNDTRAVNLTPSPLAVSESGTTRALTVSLATQPTADVTVTLTRDATQVGLTSTSLSFTPGNYATGQVVTVSAVNDALDEPSPSNYTITSLCAGGDYTGTSGAAVTVQVTDDDSTPTLAISNVAVAEGGVATVTVTMTGRSASSVSVNYATGFGGPALGGATTLNGAMDAVQTSCTVTVAGAATPGMVMVIDSEQMLVTAVAGAVLTVTRGHGGTTAAAHANGSAVFGGDFIAASGTLTWLPDTTGAKTFSVQTIDDLLDEDNEGIPVSISTAANATIATASATATITDNDATPTVQFTDAAGAPLSAQSLTEPATDTVFPLFFSLSAVSGREVKVFFGTGGSGQLGADWTSPISPVTIAAGTRTVSIGTLTVKADTLHEGAETAVLTLATPTNATVGTTNVHTITINPDADAPPAVTLSSLDLVAENETGTLTLIVTKSHVSGLAVTVPFTLGGLATVGPLADATVTSSPLVIAAGAASGTITITVANDTLDEVDEDLSVTLDTGSLVNATAGPITTLTATIQDDDAQPTVAFTAATTAVAESSPSAVITAQLSAVSGKAVQIPYVIDGGVAGAATRTTDYSLSPQAPDTIVIPAGSLSAALTVSPVNDDLDEANEVVRVTMGTVVNASAVGIDQHDLTITDDDATPTIAVSAASISETGGSASLAVTLTGKSASTVSVSYATFAGTTLVGGIDAAVTTATVASAAGIAPNVEIQIGAERLLVTAVVGTTLTVTRGIRGTSAAAHANAAAVTGTATPGADFIATSGTLSWNPGTTGSQTVAVPINDDFTTEGVEVTGFGLSAPVNATVPAVGAAAALTIIDDDSPGVRLSVATVNVTEGGTTATYTLRLNNDPTADGTTVRVTPGTELEVSADGSSWGATLDLTFNRSTKPNPYNTPQTVHVRAKDDAVYELSHAASLTHAIQMTSSPEYPVSMEIGSVAATITDNEPAPQVTISLTASANETAGTIAFTAAIDRESAFTTSATYATVAGTALAAADFTSALGSVSWAPRTTASQTITVTLLADVLDEDDELFTVSLSAPVGATLGANSTGTATIVDDVDDTPPTVTFVSATASGAEPTATTAGTAITVGLQLSAASGRTVSVPFTLGGTAGIGSDALVTASPVVFAAGETAQQLAIITIDDAVVEGSETVVATLGAPTNAAVGAPGACTVTISDDDVGALVVAHSGADTTVSEAGATDTYTVVLDKEPAATVVVTATPGAQLRVDTDPGTAGDQTTLSFTTSDWNQPRVVTVFAVDDQVQETSPLAAAIAHAVTSGPGSYAAASLTGIIVTDDDSASIQVSASGSTTAESGTTLTVSVVLGTAPSADVALTFISTDTTEGTITPTTTTTLTFTSANWDQAQLITLTGADDAIDDGDVAYAVRCTARASADPFYAALALPTDVAVVNRDDDTRGVIVIPTSTLLTTEAGGQAVFVVALRSQPDNGTTVRIPLDIAVGGTGEAELDRTHLDFTAANWAVPQVVTVTGKDDAVDDGNGAYTVRLQAITAQGGPANDYTGLDADDLNGVNNDNETAQVLVTVGSAIAVDEAQTLTGSYQVRLATQPTAAVAVTAQADSQSELSLNGTTWAAQHILTFTSATGAGGWDTNQTVLVRAKDDAIAEGDHACTIRHSAAGSLADTYNGLTVSSVAGTVTDNDTAGYTLAAATSPLTTTEAGGQDSFTVRLRSQPTANVVVLLSSSDSTEGSVGQPSVSFSPGDWSTARTITVTGLDDRIVDGTQNYQVVTAQALSNDLVYNGSDPADVAVANSDDDSAGISVNVIGTQTTESGGSVSLQVSLTSQPAANVTVTMGSSDTTEGALSSEPTVLTFTTATWSTTQTVAVTGADDAMVDGLQTYAIAFQPSASSDSNYANITPANIALTNADNDVAGITVTPAHAPTLLTTEAGGIDTFTVRLTSQPSAAVTIPVSSLDTSEFTVSTASLVFSDTTWADPQTVTVTGVNDSTVDGAITAVVSLGVATSTDLGYAGLDPTDVTVSNADDDVASVAFTPASGMAVSEGGATVTYAAVLTAQPSGTVTITVNPGAQLTVSPTTLTFTAGDWNTPHTVTVAAVDDSLAEGAHGGTITHGITGGGYDAVVVPNQAVAVTDNDAAGVSVTGGPVTVAETGTSTTVMVVLTSQPTAQVSVNLASTAAGEASVSPASLLFTTSDWNVPRAVIITGVDDLVDDGDQVVSIQIPVPTTADPTYAAIDPADVTVTVSDNDARALVVAPTAVVVNEQGATAAVQVRLASQPTATVTVSATVSDATEAAVLPASLVFTTSNWSQAQSLSLSGLDDSIADGSQAFQLQFTVTGGDYAAQAVTPVDGINQDDDQAGVLVTQTGGGSEVTEGGATDSVAVSLTTAPVGGPVTISVSGGGQLGLGATALVFTSADFSTPQILSIAAVDDNVAEGAHAGTLSFAASGADYGAVGVPSLGITITDNDTAAVLVSPVAGLITDEGGRSASFLVSLGSQPTADVMINLTSSDTAEGTLAPATLTFTALDWAQAKTVTLTGIDDFRDDGDRVYAAVLAQATSGDQRYAAIDPTDVAVTNRDDDTAGITLSPSSGLVAPEGGSAAFSITLAAQPLTDVTIELVSSLPAQASVPASVTISAATWNQPATVVVTGVQDLLVDGDQAFTIATTVQAGADPTYLAINPIDVSGTVIDDDQARVLVQSAGLTVTESGTQASFSVRLSIPPMAGETVTVDLATAGGQVGIDLAQLLFTDATYATPQTITVSAINDAVAEGEHAATISGTVGSAPGGGTYAATTVLPLTVTILDNDTAGVLVTPTAGLVTTEVGGSATFTVALSSQPTQDVVISLASTDAGQGGVSPAQVAFTAVNWATAQTVTVSGADGNGREDGDVLYQVLTTMRTSGTVDPRYAAIDPADVSVLSRTAANPPTMSVPSTLALAEDGGAQTITLTDVGNGQPLSETGVVVVTAAVDDALLVTGLAVDYSHPATTGSVQFVPGANRSGTATITITATDSDGTTPVLRLVTVTVSPVNDLPVLSTPATAVPVNRNATIAITPAMLSASDVESAAAGLVFTVSLRPSQGSLEVLRGTWTALSSGATFTQAEIASGLRYVHGNGTGVADGFAVTVSDGVDTSAVGVVNLAINVGLVQPIITISGATATWREADGAGGGGAGGTGPVQIAANASVVDPDFLPAQGFQGGSLTVTVAGGRTGTASQERLAIRNQGTASGQIGVTGTSITYGGTAFGAISSDGVGQPLVITFDLAATEAAIGALIANLQYDFTGDDAFGDRTISIVCDDGRGGVLPAPTTSTVTVVPANDAPILGGTSFSTAQGVTLAGTVLPADPEGTTPTVSAGVTLLGTFTFTAGPVGTFSYVPTAGQSGTETIQVTVSDGVASVVVPVTVRIIGGSDGRPWITSDPPIEAQVGGEVRYAVQADGSTIAAGTTLSWSLENAPTGMTVSSTGALTAAVVWAPVPSSGVGYQMVRLIARDPVGGGVAVQELTLKVNAAPAGGG